MPLLDIDTLLSHYCHGAAITPAITHFRSCDTFFMPITLMPFAAAAT